MASWWSSSSFAKVVMSRKLRGRLMRVGDFLAVAGVLLVLVTALVGCGNTKVPPTQGGPGPEAVDVVLAVHGGTAELDPATTPPEQQQAYRDGVSGAVRAGYAVLRKGGSS